MIAMCGICNLVRCVTGNGRSGRRNCGCGCDCEYERSRRWCEPQMRITCASGLGTRSDCPCHDNHDCGCVRKARHANECDCDWF